VIPIPSRALVERPRARKEVHIHNPWWLPRNGTVQRHPSSERIFPGERVKVGLILPDIRPAHHAVPKTAKKSKRKKHMNKRQETNAGKPKQRKEKAQIRRKKDPIRSDRVVTPDNVRARVRTTVLFEEVNCLSPLTCPSVGDCTVTALLGWVALGAPCL
jgi:hypothetical protein